MASKKGKSAPLYFIAWRTIESINGTLGEYNLKKLTPVEERAIKNALLAFMAGGRKRKR